MNQKIKIAIIVIVILFFGFNCIKNSKIENAIEEKLAQIDAQNDVSLRFKDIDCSGFKSVDCEVKKIKLITEKTTINEKNQTEISKNELNLNQLKLYNVENYADLENGVENKDVNIKIDFLGFKLDKKSFTSLVEEKHLKELFSDIYKSINYFDVHTDMIINLKSVQNGDFNKFDLKNLEINAGEFSLIGNLSVKNLSFNEESKQDFIIDKFNFVFKENNLKSIFVNWLGMLQTKYPTEYNMACESVYMNPNSTNPLRLYAKLKDSFIINDIESEISKAQFKYQKDLYEAIKLVLNEKADSVHFDFNNKTQISLNSLVSNIMMQIITQKNPNQFILDNIDLKIIAK